MTTETIDTERAQGEVTITLNAEEAKKVMWLLANEYENLGDAARQHIEQVTIDGVRPSTAMTDAYNTVQSQLVVVGVLQRLLKAAS